MQERVDAERLRRRAPGLGRAIRASSTLSAVNLARAVGSCVARTLPRRVLCVLLLPCALSACSPGAAPAPTPPPSGLGADVANIASDTRVVKEAQEAASAILRNTDDCDAVKARVAEVQAALDQSQARARTGTGRTAIENLKKQVRDVAAACP